MLFACGSALRAWSLSNSEQQDPAIKLSVLIGYKYDIGVLEFGSSSDQWQGAVSWLSRFISVQISCKHGTALWLRKIKSNEIFNLFYCWFDAVVRQCTLAAGLPSASHLWAIKHQIVRYSGHKQSTELGSLHKITWCLLQIHCYQLPMF